MAEKDKGPETPQEMMTFPWENEQEERDPEQEAKELDELLALCKAENERNLALAKGHTK